MQNALFQVQGDQIIIDKNDLTMYAIAAGAVVLLVIIIAVALKRRKRGFIKTLPTNLKDEK